MTEASENTQFLNDCFEKLGLPLNERQQAQFLHYAALLAEWNEKINLTAITDYKEVAVKHFADSCAPAAEKSLADKLKTARLADIGTGAGFPGVPLKILFPEMELTLMDSLAKRIRFLEMLCGELGLEGVRCVHGRAEDLAKQPEYREQFDAVTARAVAQMNVLAEYTLPFVRKGGCLLAYKGADTEEELAQARAAVRLLGGGAVKTRHFTLPEGGYGRSLIIIEKIAATPARYPRKAGTAAKAPLGAAKGGL